MIELLRKLARTEDRPIFTDAADKIEELRRLLLECHNQRDEIGAELVVLRRQHRKLCGTCGSHIWSASREEER